MNIIVAEDDLIYNEIIAKILQSLGHQVRTFLTASEAWSAFQAEPAEVVVSDWIMPGMDGLEFCRCLRASEQEKYVYFIMITGGRTGASDQDEAMKAGVDDFLVKPIHTDQIWRRLFVAQRILDFTNRIQQLKSLLPSCTCCKKIRVDTGYWESFEAFIEEQPPQDSATPYVCPACREIHGLPTGSRQ